MDMTNLSNTYESLLSHMESHGYSDCYIRQTRSEVDWILGNASGNTWNSYNDIYEQQVSTGTPTSKLHIIRSVLGAIEAFDARGEFPNGRPKPLFANNTYLNLCLEYKEIVDYGIDVEMQRGNKPSTIESRKYAASSFFLEMQNRGHHTVDSIQEQDVLSYFIKDSGNDYDVIHGRTTMCSIRTILKDSLPWRDGICERLLGFLPETKSIERNIQYLTDKEVDSIESVLEAGDLSKRDTAMVTLLLSTGLRSCDITSLKFSNIDWEKETITLIQQKTNVGLVLPLTPKVGNRIYDYCTSERPEISSEYIFLRECTPYERLTPSGLAHIVDRLFDKIGIRLNPGDRRGTHIFRHHVATELLKNGLPAPVIAGTIGQESQSSLNKYLHADIVHLKEFALDVSEFFPIKEGGGNED